MSNLLTGIVGLTIGLVWGSVFASELFFAPGAELSPGTGLSVGVCTAARTAQAQGYLTPEEVRQVIETAVQQVNELLTSLPRGELISDEVECEVALDRLRNIQG